jgi:prefoldin subunit 5
MSKTNNIKLQSAIEYFKNKCGELEKENKKLKAKNKKLKQSNRINPEIQQH